MLQVSQNIINVFCTDRKPNGVRMNATCQQFFFVQLMSQNAAESAMPKSATATPFGTVRAFTP